MKIYYTVDDKYAYPALASIQSIREHTTTDFEFVVVHTRLSNYFVNLFDINNVNTIDISNLIRGYSFYLSRYFSQEAYYRMFIPFIETEPYIYIDADSIVLSDIAEFAEYKVNFIGACYDVCMFGRVRTDLAWEFGSYDIFASGIYLHNDLGENVKKQMIYWLTEYENRFRCSPEHHDMTLLNYMYYSRWDELPLEWCVPNDIAIKDYIWKRMASSERNRYLKAKDNIKCLQFSSRYKPWNTDDCPNADLYYKYYNKVKLK